jgi:PucR C-terminal helix-turn-helix domain/GGDEF-like domain
MSLDELRIGLVARLRSRSAEIEEAIVARIRNVASDPAGSGDVQYEEGQVAAVAAVLDYALTGIEQGEERATLIPSEAVAQVRRAARSGVGVDMVVRRYTAGYAELVDFVTQEADRGGLLSHGAALRSLQRTQALLLDRLLVTVTEEHAREVERVDRSPEQRHAERVRRLLAGGVVDAAELGYELDTWHLGVIGTGLGVGQAVRGLAAGLGYQLLSVSHDERSVLAWLGGGREAVVGCVERLSSANWPAGVSLALGEPAEGLAGWRITHYQAQAALRVALRSPQRFTRYADVALLASMLQNEALAKALVATYISPFTQTDAGAVWRRTLRAYLDVRQQTSSAAVKLGVTRQTVENHLRAIEKALGRPIHTCPAELDIALRLEELGESPDVH